MFEKNSAVFHDQVVLDIGCGTGVLSIFAAKAGARQVFCVDYGDIAYFAKEIVKKNKLDDKITVIKSKIEEVQLPVDKVDIIIHEMIGVFVVAKNEIDPVLGARDKWLKKGGLVKYIKLNYYRYFQINSICIWRLGRIKKQ
jgi:predicted RNA methylase